MMEEEDGWLTVLEKNGLRLAAEILENHGMDSETDLSVLDQDDFSKLASRGLKPLHRWVEGRIARGRTHSTYLIGGSQTVQRCQDSRTCCVQF